MKYKIRAVNKTAKKKSLFRMKCLYKITMKGVGRKEEVYVTTGASQEEEVPHMALD